MGFRGLVWHVGILSYFALWWERRLSWVHVDKRYGDELAQVTSWRAFEQLHAGFF